MDDNATGRAGLLVELGETQRRALEAYREHGTASLIKASELVFAVPDPEHSKGLSLASWKLLHLMLTEAQKDGFTSRKYAIARSDARRSHKGNERIPAMVRELRQTPLQMQVVSPAGKPALLTVNILSSTMEEVADDADDLLYFRFTEEFQEIYKASSVWAKLSTHLALKFQSVYSFRLYELGAQMYRRNDNRLRVTVSRLRELLHVAPGKYADWAQLRRRTIEPAIEEVNQVAPFDVQMPLDKLERKGKKVVGVDLHAQGCRIGGRGTEGADPTLRRTPGSPQRNGGESRR